MGFGPGGLDCDDVLKTSTSISTTRPTTRRSATDRSQHLDDCAPCLRQFGLEQDVKSLIARCCGGDAPRSSLRERIRVRITEVTIETAHLEYRAE